MIKMASSVRLDKDKLVKRLKRELTALKNQSGERIYVEAYGAELSHWKARIFGPEGTPYEGGQFVLLIDFTPEYPFMPPKVKFETKIWHPNISSQTGAICLDILAEHWSASLNVRTLLLSIQALMSAPEPSDPQDAEVARMFTTNYPLFVATATTWTETFASLRTESSSDDKVKSLTEMGFEAKVAEEALQKHNWNETEALNWLLS